MRCAYCQRFISGKVLQAGDNNHFHPTCARCTKCGDPFGDGEEMYLQGAAIWHPRCGPGPGESGLVVNGYSDTASMVSPSGGGGGKLCSDQGARWKEVGGEYDLVQWYTRKQVKCQNGIWLEDFTQKVYEYAKELGWTTDILKNCLN